MDATDLLEQLLQVGKKLAEQGLAEGARLAAQGRELAHEGLGFAEYKFQIPQAGPERDKLLSQLGAGAATGGVLAVLLGTQGGRKTLSRVAKIGSLAALGALGYQIYSDHQKARDATPVAPLDAAKTQTSLNSRCLMIVQAMIAAAKSDGKIDDQERRLIENRLRNSELDQPVITTLLADLPKPLVVAEIASLAKTPMDGVDIYLASLMVLDDPTEAEQRYLSKLVTALELDPVLAQRLESDAFRPI